MDVDLARDVGATGDEGSLSPLRKLTSEAREGSVERKWIRRLVCEGKTESALSQLEAYPTVKTGQVGFELQCCHLVGMIIAAAAGRKEAASGGRGTDRDAVGMSLKRKGEAHDGRSSSPKTPKLGLHNDGNSSPGRQRKSQSPMDDSSLPSLPAALSFPEIDLEDRILSYGRQLRRTLEELPAPRDRMDRLFSNCMGLLAFEDPMGEGVVLGRGGEAALMLWTGRANLAEKLVDAMLREYNRTSPARLARELAAAVMSDGNRFDKSLTRFPPVCFRSPLYRIPRRAQGERARDGRQAHDCDAHGNGPQGQGNGLVR